MDWQQLKQLDREGLVDVESQTVTHPLDLRKLSDAHLRFEFGQSRATLSGKLGKQISYLAYPNGKFDVRCERAAKSAGYLMAFSERLTPAERSGSLFSVSRYVHTKMRQGWRDCQQER
jgi:hypothetical protein